MRPITELCSGEQAHLFVLGLTLCHLDAVLNANKKAQQFLRADVQAALASLGIDVIQHRTGGAEGRK
jgi:hypothetical protein